MKLIKTILICLISGQLFGTAQIPDFLIYQGDTLAIYANPLEGYFDKKGERTIAGLEMEGMCTALWRGYVGTWTIERDSLFLISIETDYCSDDPIKLDISQEFGSNKVFADWVSSELINPFGKQIKYIHQGYESIYEYERGFEFINGKLVRENKYDNSKSRESIYSKQPELLHKFLYENINWDLVAAQNLSEKKRVIASFRIGNKEKPTAIKIMRGINPKIDAEAERVLKLIPGWSVYYRRGKILQTQWNLPIFFDKEFYEKKFKKENRD
jgi:hypothetical protein